MSTFGLYCGRFQPFHCGHLAQCKAILERHSILVVGIAVMHIKHTPAQRVAALAPGALSTLVSSLEHRNNPFSFFQTLTMVKNALLGEQLQPQRFIISPYFSPLIFDDIDHTQFLPPKADTMRYIPLKSDQNVASVGLYLDDGWSIMTLDPAYPDPDQKEPEPVYSATQIRNLLRAGKPIAGLVPPTVEKDLREFWHIGRTNA